MRRHGGRTVNTLCRWHKIRCRRLVDAGYELLRVAVYHRKPRRLDLHHDAVPLEKDVVMVAQRDLPGCRLICSQWRRPFVAVEIAPAPNLHRDGQLVTI